MFLISRKSFRFNFLLLSSAPYNKLASLCRSSFFLGFGWLFGKSLVIFQRFIGSPKLVWIKKLLPRDSAADDFFNFSGKFSRETTSVEDVVYVSRSGFFGLFFIDFHIIVIIREVNFRGRGVRGERCYPLPLASYPLTT